ncbi:hypothetical protein ACTHSJ_33705, partial [Paenibacillus cellulositrophicus]|uniref:hypothetical protein n=1 Tax=Paenibacillus cellulositrophicus TaxID=562959 RepID=UPI003F803EE1
LLRCLEIRSMAKNRDSLSEQDSVIFNKRKGEEAGMGLLRKIVVSTLVLGFAFSFFGYIEIVLTNSITIKLFN